MGLTSAATGRGALAEDTAFRRLPGERLIALAGNPNVGKSTLFNALTGLSQHTGNWPGKTVAVAQGRLTYERESYCLVDLPGTYSLLARSPEEEVARDFLCFGGADAAVILCDAASPERGLILALQALELTSRVVLCLNLMDEAEARGIRPRLSLLERRLEIPVVGISARSGQGLDRLLAAVARVCREPRRERVPVTYPPAAEQAAALLRPALLPLLSEGLPPRWTALRLLDSGSGFFETLETHLGRPVREDPGLAAVLPRAQELLRRAGLDAISYWDAGVSATVSRAEELCRGVLNTRRGDPSAFDLRLDRIVMGRFTAVPVMLLLLALVLWLTISAANVPSDLLSHGFAWCEQWLIRGLQALSAPPVLQSLLIDGVWRVLSWVVSVMLPPMAIFFPLFTLLEDFGYLPRMAFNLDHCFSRCGACGKQALTTAMGFGCNAAGVVGCRIIDSPRERLIAILTNSLVPCNGRFPMLIALIAVFFAGAGPLGTLRSALMLTGLILLGLLATFLGAKFLSATVLRGVPSSFTLELPPYRRPQVGKVLVRSLLDRTLKVLGRAVLVAAPAGLLIWVLASVTVGGVSLLHHCAAFLDPLGRLMGLDGVILLAFLLGFPANEIVLPIILMAYLSSGTLVQQENLTALHALLVENGWTGVTALCAMLFSLFHFPCSTTCLTIHKETGSWRWTAAAVLLPTILGILVCILVHTAATAMGF